MSSPRIEKRRLSGSMVSTTATMSATEASGTCDRNAPNTSSSDAYPSASKVSPNFDGSWRSISDSSFESLTSPLPLISLSLFPPVIRRCEELVHECGGGERKQPLRMEEVILDLGKFGHRPRDHARWHSATGVDDRAAKAELHELEHQLPARRFYDGRRIDSRRLQGLRDHHAMRPPVGRQYQRQLAKILQLDLSARGEGMARRQGQHLADACQRLDDELARQPIERRDAEMCACRRDGFDGAGRGRSLQAQGVRMLRAVRAQSGTQQVQVRAFACRQHYGRRLALGQVPREFRSAVLELARETLHLSTRFGDVDLAAASNVERCAECRRKISDLGVQRRLRQVKPRGRAREVPRLRELGEGQQRVPGCLAQQIHYPRFL